MSIKKIFSHFTDEIKRLLTPRKMVAILAGTAILSFGLYNIHRQTHITEGGVLGMILLLNYWFGITSSVASPTLDILCYIFSSRYLSKDFLKLSAISTFCLAGFFFLWEQFPPILPDLSPHPLIAAIAGGISVGIGTGVVVRQGGSTGGDDALALTISKITGCKLSLAYFFTDITVLLLSLTYIPFKRIAFSIVTVSISSYLVDFIKCFSFENVQKKYNEKKSEADSITD